MYKIYNKYKPENVNISVLQYIDYKCFVPLLITKCTDKFIHIYVSWQLLRQATSVKDYHPDAKKNLLRKEDLMDLQFYVTVA